MPERQSESHQFVMTALVYGPIRPAPELDRQTQRALKGHTAGKDFFTEITLRDAHQAGSMRIEYTVTASSPESAERAGAVYLSQLCDLLSVITRAPIRFHMPDDDARDDRARMLRRSTTIDRVLSEPEWLWVTGVLVFLRREHPRFLAAASWYRKGLIGNDALDDFCSFWRVIERLANSYADKSTLAPEDRGRPKPCVRQLASELFVAIDPPAILAKDETISEIVALRNDLSHGNVSITSEVIDRASGFLKPLEAAAFCVLREIRQQRLNSSSAPA